MSISIRLAVQLRIMFAALIFIQGNIKNLFKYLLIDASFFVYILQKNHVIRQITRAEAVFSSDNVSHCLQ